MESETLPSNTVETSHTAWNRDRRMFLLAAVILAFVGAYYLLSSPLENPLNRAQGMLMLLLAGYPTLRWTKAREKRFPLVELLLLTTGNFYAIPLLKGGEVLAAFEEKSITYAAWAVVLFQVSVIAAYQMTTGQPKRTRFWTEELITDDTCRYLNYGMLVNTLYLVASSYLDIIPPEINSIVRAACSGIGIICTFITARLWGAGSLSSAEKIFYVANLVAQAVLLVMTLYLIGTMALLLLAVLGYVTTRKAIPVLTCVVAVGLLALLHNGKGNMRAKYWGPEAPRAAPGVTELPKFFSEWIEFGLSTPVRGEKGAASLEVASKLLERASLFQMVCLVVDRTPTFQPFLDGESYTKVLAQFVPRLLWPDKPSGLQTTAMLAIYYGLQTEEATQSTSIAFGQVAEAYANFGFLGVIGVGVFLGLLYKKAQIWTAESPIISYPGAMLVILLAWTFQVEMTFGTWIGSLWQACASVIAMLVLVRSFLRQKS